MKYVKQHFVTGMKVSLPEVLNRMEDGIAAACAAAVECIGSVTTGDTPAAGIRDGKLCLTLPRGEPGPVSDSHVQRGVHLLQYQYGIHRGSGGSLPDRAFYGLCGSVFPFFCDPAGNE